MSSPSEIDVNILLVDDREENLQALEAMLAPVGHRIVSVPSGERALRFLLDHDAAVILLDVQMPGMDGFETAELIRKRARFSKTPIIFLTAVHTALEDARTGYALGAVDYINKPLVPEILLSKVTVFVDLYIHKELAKNKELAKSRLERETKELKRELEGMRRTVGAWRHAEPSEGSSASVLPPAPEELAPLRERYRSLLDAYVRSAGVRARPPHEDARGMAERLGKLNWGPREVTSLHLRALEETIAGALPSRERFLRAQCRLLSLEIMGHLVDHYRLRAGAGHLQGGAERP